MRNQLKIVYSALTMVAMLGLTSTVHGIPSFARQTGLDCNSCHATVGYPSLNAFGQAFRAGGYTQASEDTLMGDGEALSLPKSLNLALVSKIRFHFKSATALGAVDTATPGVADFKKTTTVGFNEVDMPDEWAIWLAGRAGKHIGFAAEFNQGGPLSFKMPIVYDIGPLKAGFVPYWTDAQGPGWGFETLSTGAVGNVKMFENGPAQSARMYLDDKGLSGNDGNATGFGLYLWHPMGFVYYSPYLRAGFGGATDPQFAHNVRVAITPSIAGLDAAVGIQYMTGNNGVSAGGAIPDASIGGFGLVAAPRVVISTVNYFGIDGQVQGTVGIPMMLVFTFGMTDTLKGADGKAKAGSKATAWTVLLNATLVEDLLNVGAGVRMASKTDYDATGKVAQVADPIAGTLYDSVTSDNQVIAEIKFNIARNLRLSLTGYKQLNAVDVATTTSYKVTTDSTKEDKLTVMLFGAF